MPKGDRQRSVIEKLVELGVDRLTPIDTERSVSKFDADAIEKLKRYAIEACKQSQRNRLMHIDPSIGWMEWLARSVQGEPSSLWMLHPLTLHEAGGSGVRFVRSDRWLAEDPLGAESRVGSKSRVVFAVGPEGGFTAGEVAQAIEHGVGLLDLGERILRVETAVSAAAVLGSLRIGLSISVPDSPQRREVRQV
jgi:16S rRNA (uracil1498-N3)-methyltransferase